MIHPRSSPQKPERWAPILAILALALGLFSYYWFNRHPEFPWDGPIMLLLAGGLLRIALRRVERPDAASPAPAEPEGWALPLAHVSRWRLVAFWLGVGLSLLLLSHLTVPNRPSYTGEVLLWLASIAGFVLSVAPPVRRPREDWGLWWEVNRVRVLAVGVILGAAFILRAWDLEHIPSALGGDEASQGLEAVRILNGELRNPFTTGWLGVPTMSFFFNSLTVGPMGPTIPALRLPWALIGSLTVLLTFWLVTRLRGLTLGLMTAGLLAAYHYHIHFSRLGSNQVADPFFVALALLFLYRARDRQSPLDWSFVGISLGVAQFFYAGARLTLVVALACVLHFFWLDRNRPQKLRDLLGGTLTLLGAFAITAAPMLQYALRFPNDYNARLNEVGIFQSGWVEREMASRGVGMGTLLWEQFQRAFLAFNVYVDTTPWYSSPYPLMTGMWSVLFMLGLLYATIRIFPPRSERRFFPLVVWWWGGMLAGGVLTLAPPSSQRLIVLAPPACFFVALALWQCLQFLQEIMGRRDLRYLAPFLAVGVLTLAAQSIRFYFWEFTPLNRYGSENGRIATEVGRFLARELDPDETLIFLGPPQIQVNFATIPYLAPEAKRGKDQVEPLTVPPTDASLALPAGQSPLFVALPSRAYELDQAELGYPNGTRTPVFVSGNPNPLFWVYDP